MRDIGPLSQSTADIRNAADALYDEAAEKLVRAAMIQEVYDVTLTGVAAQIRAGDRARILYHSDTSGNPDAPYLSVDGTFIVLEATETVNVDHAVVSLKVSNIDRQPVGAIEILLQAIQKLELHSLKPNIVQGAPTAYVYDREIAPGLSAEVPVEFTDSTLELNRCRLRLKTSPLRTTAVDELDVPAHQHVIGLFSNSTSGTATHSGILVNSGSGGFSNIGGNNALIGAQSAVASGRETWYTAATEPNITSQIAFDIHDDAAYPGDITVRLRNADITQQLFGVARLAATTMGTAPPGTLADFSFTAGLDSSNRIWSVDLGVGTLLSGGNAQGIVPLALPNGTDIEICTIQWAATGETDSEKPQIEDRVGGIGFREIDDQLPNHSVYFWEGTQIYEFRIDDIDGERDNYIQWSGTGNGLDRPSGISTGATVRCIIATSGQTAVVQAYAMLQPPATGAINEVGDPGVLANLLTAQPGRPAAGARFGDTLRERARARGSHNRELGDDAIYPAEKLTIPRNAGKVTG